MKPYRRSELPPELQRAFRKARRLEWLTIAYLVSAIVLMALVLGNSQAMKTAWFEDILSLVPPIAFLIAARFFNRPPTERFSYGYHRVISIAYLCASLALFVMGAYLLMDSALKLVLAEHPTIGTIVLFDHPIWLGWLMIAALLYSAVPPVFLGHAKMPPARNLHDKVLYADADMNKADWMTATAAIVGVIGIGLGWWWADASAAALISLDILKDGFTNLRHVVADLMDQTPTTVGRDEQDPLRGKLLERLERLQWVEKAEVRLREEGQVCYGEAFVVPYDEANITEKLAEALRAAHELDWRVHDLVVVPVRVLPREEK